MSGGESHVESVSDIGLKASRTLSRINERMVKPETSQGLYSLQCFLVGVHFPVTGESAPISRFLHNYQSALCCDNVNVFIY